MKKLISICMITVFAAAMLVGCNNEETDKAVVSEAVTAEPTNAAKDKTAIAKNYSKATATPTPTQVPTQDLSNINPLTGEASVADVSNVRTYVFMCDNTNEANPHAGVSKSDMIMEMMEEGGITRLMAFFTDISDVEKIGPIRSARAYNVDTALGYDAFLVHCGGSDEALEMILNLGMQDVDQMSGAYGEAFYRDSTRMTYGAVHSLVAVGPSVIAASAANGYRLVHEDGYDKTYGLSFSDTAVSQCTKDATNIQVVYNGGKTTSFAYNAESKTYAMYQFGEEYKDDGVTAVPFSNVINIYANTYLQSDGLHLTIELTSGTGTFFTEGKAVDILWYKNGQNDVFHYTLSDGTPLQLSKGRTFVCVNQCGSYQGDCAYN